MRTVIIAVLYGFSINIPSTFFTVYLLQNVKVGYTYITALSLLNIPCMVLFTPLWRKVISRTGSWFKMIQIAMTGYLFNYILLALVTPANYSYMYPLAMLVAYPFNAGLALGFTNELYINMPAENGTLYSAFHTVAYSVASFLGVTVSRAIMQHTEGVVLNILGIPMINKQFYLLVAAAVMGVSSVVIFFLRRNLAKEGYDS